MKIKYNDNKISCLQFEKLLFYKCNPIIWDFKTQIIYLVYNLNFSYDINEKKNVENVFIRNLLK